MMKNCRYCSSIHEEFGDICRVCILNRSRDDRFEATRSMAYKNMLKGKNVHPCPDCKRLTPDINGTFCKICSKSKIERNTEHYSVENKGDKMPNPRKVNWENLIWLMVGSTILSSVVIALFYFIPFFLSNLLFVLLWDGFPYYIRIPIFIPLLVLTCGLFQHLYYKFYYGDALNSIRNLYKRVYNTIYNLKHKLVLFTLTRYNLWRTRKANIRAYEKTRKNNYIRLKEETKSDNDDYNLTRDYIIENNKEPII